MRLQKCEVRAIQRNTCFPIVERSPSFAVSVTSEVHTDLKRHMLIHSSEKNFCCDQCTYKSARAADLKGHMLFHSGEKLFSCHDCNYKSSRIDTIKRHEHGLGHNSDENGQKKVV